MNLPRPLHTYKKPIPVRKGWIENGIGYIPLTQGLLAIVDPEWVAFLEKWNWLATRDVRTGKYYAKRITSRSLGLPRKHIHMARVILGMDLCGVALVPDHINGDGLDNRRANLREATNRENVCNRRVQSSSLTGLKGAHFDKRVNRYYSRIKFNGKQISLGGFLTAEEAHARYVEEAKKLFGEFHRAA